MHHADFNAHNTLSSLRARRLVDNDAAIPAMRAQLDAVHAAKRARRRKRVLCVGLAIIAIASVLGAGVLDLQDVRADHSRYCSMVKQGLWPDFKHIYKTECTTAAASPLPARR